MQQSTRSIDVLSVEVRDQLAAQVRHFERLDAKAGVLLGFAGLFVVLAPESTHPLIDVARLAGVVSAGASLFTFLPRFYPVVDLVPLRRKYLAADAAFTRLTLLDTHMRMLEESRVVIDQKAQRLTISIVSLLVAIFLGFTGLVVES
ncbi:MAG: hypothetical protein M3279_07880 [Actinomycetota bacterium]|nr:hypothetical protein [Actinomycetota bacterium]